MKNTPEMLSYLISTGTCFQVCHQFGYSEQQITQYIYELEQERKVIPAEGESGYALKSKMNKELWNILKSHRKSPI